MTKHSHYKLANAVLFVAALISWQVPSFAQSKAEDPETVLVIYHVKPGAETELEQVIAKHWGTLVRLNLVRKDFHVLLRAQEADCVRFVEVGTWRDRKLHDSAPAEVQALWKEMNRFVEPRDGHLGIEITEVSLMENRNTSSKGNKSSPH
jgi:hypothetical protein